MHICKATMAHVRSIHRLINVYAEQGRMLRRPLASLYEQVRDFSVVIDDNDHVLAVGALHVLWHDLAELRAFAVAPEATGKGVGKMLVDHLIHEAEDIGIQKIGLLTYENEFFNRCGFNIIDKQELPQKVLRECIYCDNFESCNEVPMLKHISAKEDHSDAVACSMNVHVEVPMREDELEPANSMYILKAS